MVTNTRSLLAFILVFNSHTSHYHLSLSLSIFFALSFTPVVRLGRSFVQQSSVMREGSRSLGQSKGASDARLGDLESDAWRSLRTKHSREECQYIDLHTYWLCSRWSMKHKTFTRRMFVHRLSHILALQPLKYETHTCFAADKKRHDKRERHNDVCTYMFVIPIYVFAI